MQPVVRRRAMENRSATLLGQAWVEILRLRQRTANVANIPGGGGGGGGGGGVPAEASAHALYGSKHVVSLAISATTGLNFAWEGGQVWQGGDFFTIAPGTDTVGDDMVSCVFITPGGAIGSDVSFPTDSIPLARITAAGGAITLVEDRRSYLYPVNRPLFASGALELAVDVTPGAQFDLWVPYTCTYDGWALLATDGPGDLVVDIWLENTGSYPPTVADAITAEGKPTLSAAEYADFGVASPVPMARGQTLRFNTDSSATLTKATLALMTTRTL